MNSVARKELVTEQVSKAIWETLTKLLSIFRWSTYVADYRYNELNKQALNASICYILATEAKEVGQKIDMTRFPKIIMHRMFEKLFLCDIREDFIDRILKLGNIERQKFNDIIEKEIKNLMGVNFARFISIDEGSAEARIFQAATKLGTKWSFTSLKEVFLKTSM